MIEEIRNILLEKGYNDSDSVVKIISDLSNLNLIKVKRFLGKTLIIPNTSNTLNNDNEYIRKGLEDYFNSLDPLIKEIFPDFNYVKLCLSLGIKETPKCPICGKRVTTINNGSTSYGYTSYAFNDTCGDPECTKSFTSLIYILSPSFNVHDNKNYLIKNSLIRDSWIRRNEIKTNELKKKNDFRNKKRINKAQNILDQLSSIKGYAKEDEIYKDIKLLIENNFVNVNEKGFLIKLINDTDTIDSFLRKNNCNYDFLELKGCFKKGYKDVPKCPICGKRRMFREYFHDFLPTCNSPSCVREKQERTCLERYGTRISTQSEVIRSKIINTNIKKYGGHSPMNNPEVKETARKNQMEKYGVANISQLQYIKDKKEKTFMEHYGYKCSLMAPEIKERIKNTNLERYGYENAFSSPEIIRKSRRKYLYKEMYFDSSWELAFYIYCEDHNILIRRNPDPIPYEVDGHRHSYFPDFVVDNQYIEIKGDHLIDNNGNLLFHPAVVKLLEKVDDDTRKEYEKILSAKSELLRNLNVKILKEENIKEYMGYIKNRYGKSYIKKFRSKK